MRVVIQRVQRASVTIEGAVVGKIKQGMLILLGIEEVDTEEDIQWLCGKIAQLRIFDDTDGVMNCSIDEIDGEFLVISQFTLHASTKKGNRPSYIRAAKPHFAIPMYEKFINTLSRTTGKDIQTGKFGAMMDVSLVNDGPVTIIIDTKLKE
ncbi:MAG: D-tyrosyl-tRNA(Tyr) deacylase [Bacteroidales bacterium]|jgi:D-tyrosyl-tRNA(Tyr) deacylase|nr:D-tyrosyl-tRNA(Tyr) deacylase [Bacteroidales bacterium]